MMMIGKPFRHVKQSPSRRRFLGLEFVSSTTFPAHQPSWEKPAVIAGVGIAPLTQYAMRSRMVASV
jgi:hypothetical protein